MLCEQAYDLRVQYGVFCYDPNGDSESERKKFLETNVTEYIKQFDAFLSKNKSKFAVGDKPTVADFQLFDYIDASCSLEGGRALLDKYTNVKELLQRVRELPELKDYIPNAHAQLPISGKMSKFGGQVDTFSRAYLFDQAQKFIDEFEKSHRPSIPMSARNTSLSRKIFDRIQSNFSDVQSCLTSVTVLLADTYALSGNKLIASNIRTKLSQSSMKKAVGYSWTVISGKIFKFRAHDRSHPCSQEIYVELDRLQNELIEHGYKYDESWIIRPLENGTLDVNDLYELLPDYEAAALTDKLEANWFAETKRNPNKPSLIRATLCTLRWKPFLIGLILIPSEFFDIIQPLLLTFLMKFFEPCSTMPAWYAWLLAMSTIFTAFCSSVIVNYGIYLNNNLALQMRVAYSGLIFRKLSPLEVFILILLFWYYVKQVSLIAISYTLVLLVIQSIFSRFILHFRNSILQVTDQRVKIMSEIIKSMRIVKMYCWEMAFDKKIRHVRRREIIQYMYCLMFDCVQMLFSQTYINVTFLLMYGTMWWFNIRLDIRFFAVASCLLSHMRFSVVEFFNNAVKDLVHYMAAQKRIQTFLLLDESERDNRLLSRSHSELAYIEQNEPTIVKNNPTQLPKVICNLKQAQWEKSSLLQTLTGEIAIFDGKVRMHGSFCYVPQESWIFSSTIKTNILFGKVYDRNLFHRVVKATALDTDFAQLPNEENTLVGDQGVMLSGGEMVQIGTYTDLLASSTSFARLLDDIHQFEQQQSIELYQQQSIISSTCSDVDEEMLALSTNVETKRKGTVKSHVYVAYLKAGAGIIMGLFIVIILSFVREGASIFSNWWLAKWSDDESYRYRILNNCTTVQNNKNNTVWSMSNAEWNNHRNQRFYIYCVIVFILVLMTFFRAIITEFMFLNAGRVLHNKMFRRLIRCPIAFFDTNPVGRILNRFTKDVATMDDQLPVDIYDFLNVRTVVLVGMLNPWSFIPAVISLIGLLFVRYYYAPCSRDLRRLESITRSPVYSYLTSTIHGLKVIRSYHAEHMCSIEFFSHLDNNTRAYHLIFITNRWAALRFDWVALSFIALVTILSMILRVTGYRYFSTADIAMTLSYSLSLMGLLQWAIR
ncbi:unnamed protein product [Rotaria sordida]|uniref:Uncharacterized protein n=1 Tax=Rotaria sordida TaxID=392033 RepID=A0A819DIP4_9BILA|nr:unnamed protein product [Rotaria sordida]